MPEGKPDDITCPSMDIAISVGDFGDAAQPLRQVADAVSRLCHARFNTPPPLGEWPITIIRSADEVPRVRWPTSGEYQIALATGDHFYCQFVYQLAHELAHVWMHPCCTNAVVEAYAVALSLQVLADIGQIWLENPPIAGTSEYARHFIPYSQNEAWQKLTGVPVPVQRSVQAGRWSDVSAYLASQKSVQDVNPVNRALNTAGAMVLLAYGVCWPDLVGVARSPLSATVDEYCFAENLPLNLNRCPESVCSGAALWTDSHDR